MGEGGFQYLLEQGVVFANAHHTHANTETIVGHTTLATGATPAVHGMVGNVWFDRGSGEMTYNVEDERYGLLTQGADVDKGSEIDPTQKIATTDGRSPSVILVSTFGDELAITPQARRSIRSFHQGSRRDLDGRPRGQGILVFEDRPAMDHQQVLLQRLSAMGDFL